MKIQHDKSRVWARVRRGAFVCTALLILGEIFARYGIGLGTPPLSVAHPTIEYMFLPNQDVRRFGNRQFYNRFGMRSEDFEESRSELNELRVMVLGDSVINGGNLTAQEDLATAIVDRELEATGKYDNVIVGNISAASWGPGNQLAFAKEFGLFDADVVVLVISSHDYTDVRQFGPLNPQTHPTKTPFSALAEGFQQYLPRYLPDFGSSKVNGENPETPARGEVALDDLVGLLTLTKASGAKVVVVQYLNNNEVKTGECEFGYFEIKDACEKHGIVPTSTKRIFENAVAANQDPFRDAIHPNDLGQRLLADAILQAIQDDISIDGIRTSQNSGEQMDKPEPE